MREDKRVSESEANVSKVEPVKTRATPISVTAPKKATTKTAEAKKPATKSAAAKKKAATTNDKPKKPPDGAKAKRSFPLAGLTSA